MVFIEFKTCPGTLVERCRERSVEVGHLIRSRDLNDFNAQPAMIDVQRQYQITDVKIIQMAAVTRQQVIWSSAMKVVSSLGF